MRDFPPDPMRQHAIFMAAFCDDLMAGDYSAPRAKAVCEISRQLGANAALPRVTGLVGKPEPASRLGPPGDHPISQEQEADNG